MVPPQDMPVEKKLMVWRAGASLQRCGNTASTATSAGNCTTRALEPERIERDVASICVATGLRRRIAAVRSALSSEAVSTA